MERATAIGMRLTSIICSLLLSACRIGFDDVDPPGPDAGAIVASCSAAEVTCAGDAVRSCAAPSATPTVETCAWGCVAAGGAHCGVLDPETFGSEALSAPTAPLADLVLADTWITAAGAISGGTAPFTPALHGAFEGEQNGIDFRIHDGVGIYRVQSLHITGPLHLAPHDWGTAVEPVAIVAAGPIVIDGVIDGQSACNTDDMAAPGGYRANLNIDPSGHAPSTQSAGGGGGGNGGTGGAGNGPGGRPVWIGGLVGGGGGGGSGSPSIHHGVGGAGGAALQLISHASITINRTGGINAGGCGGYVGDYQHGGGGGGAGGTLVLQAPTIAIAGKLAVNGGAGANASTRAGESGLLARVAATGGGGSGGYAGSPDGANAPSATTGGGGAIGRIRLETRNGDVWLDASAVLSPSQTDQGTTTVVRAATVR